MVTGGVAGFRTDAGTSWAMTVELVRFPPLQTLRERLVVDPVEAAEYETSVPLPSCNPSTWKPVPQAVGALAGALAVVISEALCTSF